MEQQKHIAIFIAAKDLKLTVGLSRARVNAMVRNGEFPLPKRISAARIAWLRSDLEAWAASRPTSVDPVRTIRRREPR